MGHLYLIRLRWHNYCGGRPCANFLHNITSSHNFPTWWHNSVKFFLKKNYKFYAPLVFSFLRFSNYYKHLELVWNRRCCFWKLKKLLFTFSKTCFHFQNGFWNELSFSKCGYLLKCAFIFKIWKVLWFLFFLFPKNTIVNKNLYIHYK